MSNSKDFSVQCAERAAAQKLLTEFLTSNAPYFVSAFETVIPFFNTCSMSGLKSAINVVNVTFASIALDVINSRFTTDDDGDRQYLPVDATEMKDAIYYLSKLIDSLTRLAAIFEDNYEHPAIRMCNRAFGKAEIYG